MRIHDQKKNLQTKLDVDLSTKKNDARRSQSKNE